MDLSFTLNGRGAEVTAPVTANLATVLRDHLHLTGTKIGCSQGNCGACTVHLDGSPVNACLVLAATVKGRRVDTVEGIGTLDHPHPLQSSFTERYGSQCGFCTPGMLMAAKALLDRASEPTREDVVEALGGNLCRCTGYQKIVEAVLAGAEGAVTGLQGIIPVVVVPFDDAGAIDERGLRNVVRFELDGGVHGIGVNGFASEAYKLRDEERLRVAKVVADEVAGSVPLVIGISPGSLEAALAQAEELADLGPAALMTLPPSTFGVGGDALTEFYAELGRRTPAPVMVQQATHIHAYSASFLDASELVAIADAAPAVTAFKIEGPRAPTRIAELAPLVADRDIALFGGGGGITFLDELRAGASGLIPGVGFNERFVAAWDSWTSGDAELASALVGELQPLVDAVSGQGHEFSIHARKQLLLRAGLVSSAFVRSPTVGVDEESIEEVIAVAASIGLRLLAEVAP